MLQKHIGDDPNFATTVATSLSNKADLASPIFTGTVDFTSATVNGIEIPPGTTVSDTAPSTPDAGQLWWNSTDGTLYIYYDSFWVTAVTGVTGPTGPTGLTGPAGPTGPTGADGTFSSTQTVQTNTGVYTLTSADAGKLILNSDALTVTVQGLTVGQQVDFLQDATSQITFVAGAGMTLTSKRGNLKTSERYSPAGIKCVASNTYVLVGDLGG